MGYRNYIGYIPKREYNKIKSLTTQEVYDYYKKDKDEDYIGAYEFCKKLYELGKYVEFKPPTKSILTFFKNKKTQKYWNEDGELVIVTKEFLAYVIDSYKEKVKNYYNDMVMPFFGKRDSFLDHEDPSNFLNSIKTEYNYPNNKYKFDFTKITDDEQTALFKIMEHVRSMRSEWTVLTPYDLEEGDEVTTSWKYEYAIFELIKIYKTFDWKRNIMVYYGY